LLGDYTYFLNLGGIANISANINDRFLAFDVCAANRVLNMLAEEKGVAFDKGGKIAAAGNINNELLQKLNELEYYKRPHPKSLANDFGVETVFPIIKKFSLTTEDAMRTYVEHIVVQIKNAIVSQRSTVNSQLLVTGGGAFNTFLINRLKEVLQEINIKIFIPDENLIKYKEALIMALMGALRWREEYNVLASVTGAKRNSIGGALWLGTEA
jgi:anhydro-N-acetylmuramic acid kinase